MCEFYQKSALQTWRLLIRHLADLRLNLDQKLVAEPFEYKIIP